MWDSPCPNCGADGDNIIPVWEEKDRAFSDQHPKFIGCESCHQMMTVDLLREEDDFRPSQVELTEHEKSRLPMGNQNTSSPTLIQWQVIKGAAAHFGVQDWTAKVDWTLTVEENITLMERAGSKNAKTSLRNLPSPGEHRGGRQ